MSVFFLLFQELRRRAVAGQGLKHLWVLSPVSCPFTWEINHFLPASPVWINREDWLRAYPSVFGGTVCLFNSLLPFLLLKWHLILVSGWSAIAGGQRAEWWCLVAGQPAREPLLAPYTVEGCRWASRVWLLRIFIFISIYQLNSSVLTVLKGLGCSLWKLYISSKLRFVSCWKALLSEEYLLKWKGNCCPIWRISALQGCHWARYMSGLGRERERVSRERQGFAGTRVIVRVGGWEEEMGDFGKHFAQGGASSPSPPACLPPVPPLFPLCWGCGTVATQLTHSLVSIPFCSCTRLLLLPARNVLS